MDDNNENNDDNLEENISYEAYKLLLEAQKEKEMNEIAENQNLTIQEKIIINLEKELSQLNLEQKNILFSNDEMLKLDPNDKDIIESREINLDIYKKNEIRIKEIKDKINTFQKKLDEENVKNKEILNKENKSDKNQRKYNIYEDKDKDKKEDILNEIEL